MNLHSVDIDHIVPLSAAWDLGAWQWSAEKRRAFANDVERNLIAVSSQVNREKSDQTLSQWLPPDPRARCAYAARFLAVVLFYDIAIPRADLDTARAVCHL